MFGVVTTHDREEVVLIPTGFVLGLCAFESASLGTGVWAEMVVNQQSWPPVI